MPFLVTRCGVLETPGIVPELSVGALRESRCTREEDLSEWEA